MFKEKEYGKAKSEPTKEKPAPDPKSFRINTVFKEPIYRIPHQIKKLPYFKWLRRQGGDKEAKRATNQHYSYHKDWGHMTEDFEMYKKHLDDLVAQLYLKEFIEEWPKGHDKTMELDYEQGPNGVIHMIHG